MKDAVKIVRKPMMRLLDKNYLSVKVSSLFKRKFRKGDKKKRKLLKKKTQKSWDTYSKYWWFRLSKFCLHTSTRMLKVNNQAWRRLNFDRQWLFNAALKVVCKRRANHIQHYWCLHNRPKDLFDLQWRRRPASRQLVRQLWWYSRWRSW